jgi:arylsulfatase A-like enzyme
MAFLALVAAAGAGRSLPAAEEPARKPNIVFVFADQHRNGSWPGGGDPQVKTPNLDVLARGGVTFTHCYSNHPLCSPYRASLLTGRYQQATTIHTNIGEGGKGGLPASEVTIADLLLKAGYATGYVGKWHLYPGSHGGKVVPPGPDRHGFEWWRACFNYRKRYDTRYYDDDGKEVVIRDYAPKGQMDLTMEFIEKNAARPFCVFLSWHPPHSPYTEAPKPFADLYDPATIALRPNVPKADDTKRLREEYAGYFASVSALDAEVGRLVKKLDDLGIAGNTVVCYSSDHGDMLGSFGLKAKNKPWEESINVPFIVRWPAGIPEGKRLDTLFSTVDIAPTLLGLAGVPVPDRMQGADLSDIVRGKPGDAGPGPASVFIMGGTGGGEDEGEEGTGGGRAGNRAGRKGKGGAGGGWQGVRTARYTYAKEHDGAGWSPWLLFDNEKDPFQQHNRVKDPELEGTRQELEAMLEQWRKRVGG